MIRMQPYTRTRLAVLTLCWGAIILSIIFKNLWLSILTLAYVIVMLSVDMFMKDNEEGT